ncbi:cupin domain-containing protein [Aestuariibaculum sediminum]|uniref:Cupin domain-containing protein n=1 Tax=Aestuariibaculum sediminum TaxID=2770637 RepID=A0A8J6Q144_9FLAO|nr:cupin domain-containing protein [Aestuariibaculum sediminum]MBD0830890.1 cupin domain-containing protein [Aestuariibaculum sediminum]
MKTTSLNITLTSFLVIILFQANTLYAQMAENSIAKRVSDKDLKWLPAPDFFPNCSFTLLHGEMSDPNLDLFFKIEANTEVVRHTHKSPERMILMSGDMEVQYEGEKPVIVKAGSYLYGPAGKPHRAKCLDNGPCVLFIALVDTFDAVVVKE